MAEEVKSDLRKSVAALPKEELAAIIAAMPEDDKKKLQDAVAEVPEGGGKAKEEAKEEKKEGAGEEVKKAVEGAKDAGELAKEVEKMSPSEVEKLKEATPRKDA